MPHRPRRTGCPTGKGANPPYLVSATAEGMMLADMGRKELWRVVLRGRVDCVVVVVVAVAVVAVAAVAVVSLEGVGLLHDLQMLFRLADTCIFFHFP